MIFVAMSLFGKRGWRIAVMIANKKQDKNLSNKQKNIKKKIKKETQCPACGFIGVDIEQCCNDDHGLYWETFYKCKNCGRKTKDTQWYVYKKPTVFEIITASPEVLAPMLVFYDYDTGGYESTITNKGVNEWSGSYNSEPEAIAATLARLKEVCNE